MVNLRGGLLHFLHLFSYCTYCTLFRQVLNLRDGIFEFLELLNIPQFPEVSYGVRALHLTFLQTSDSLPLESRLP